MRAALGGEAKAAALSRRAALARRAAKALHPRPMETVPLASDNVKCSMPLTLASAVDPTVQEPKIKFTSECSCNGDEVDCQSLKPCKCAFGIEHAMSTSVSAARSRQVHASSDSKHAEASWFHV